MTNFHDMNRLGVRLEEARLRFAMTHPAAESKADAAEVVTELTRQCRAAERAVMAQALDLAECIPQDGSNFRTVRELILTLQALVHIEEHIL